MGVKALGGQCDSNDNKDVGNWYSLPIGGRCNSTSSKVCSHSHPRNSLACTPVHCANSHCANSLACTSVHLYTVHMVCVCEVSGE
jgi:hypothetical protein